MGLGQKGSIYAGTSGFAYPKWKPAFYPQKLPQNQFLSHYASRLNAVEINYTFRQNPSAKTVQGWVEATPADFVFAMKAHMRITHIQRLKNAGGPTAFFLQCIDPLRATRRLGVVLFQLPPTMKADVPVLREFVAALPGDIRFAFEFRHPSWFDEAVYQTLQEKNCCFCLAESDKLEAPPVITADFVYFRLRKAEYPEEERRAIEDRVRALSEDGRTVFVFFKHEDTPDGALYSEQLLRDVAVQRVRVPGGAEDKTAPA